MTLDRREFLVGGLLFGALGASEFLRPRERLDLLGGQDMDAIVPQEFGAWASSYDPGLVVPVQEGSLADKLYDNLITRRYINSDNGAQMLLLIAHGASQTDALQLHRPESCYPAVGLQIVEREEMRLPIAGRSIPAVGLVASAPGRTEDIVYWTRMGPRFPQSAGVQRSDKLDLAMQGLIPDGVLIRASMIRTRNESKVESVGDFLSALVDAMEPSSRVALVGKSS